MNSDFEEAFKEKWPHLKIVYDYFHIVKNFNDKVVSQVRKYEQKRLIEVGDIEGAKALKGCKYILTFKKATLRTKDNDAFLGKEISKGSELFKKESVEQTGNQLGWYYTLLCQNELLFSLDFLKEAVEATYRENTTDRMKAKIEYIIKFCEYSENEHFQWFGKLLKDHFDGIVSHAKYPLSNGKEEGVNQKIKTIRRKSDGLPDDEYFFLKHFDAHRQRWISMKDD